MLLILVNRCRHLKTLDQIPSPLRGFSLLSPKWADRLRLQLRLWLALRMRMMANRNKHSKPMAMAMQLHPDPCIWPIRVLLRRPSPTLLTCLSDRNHRR
jgi:hypothetical protein